MYTNVVICKVVLSASAEKDLRRVPKYIKHYFFEWVKMVQLRGLAEMQHTKGYRDHALKGNRKGQLGCWKNR